MKTGKQVNLSPRDKIIGCALVAGFFAILISMKILNTSSTVFHGSGPRIAIGQILFPQSWGFFTKDPQEPQLYIYHHNDGQWQEVDFLSMRKGSSSLKIVLTNLFNPTIY